MALQGVKEYINKGIAMTVCCRPSSVGLVMRYDSVGVSFVQNISLC